jgi:biopolymer transport protein ExbB/TolQ
MNAEQSSRGKTLALTGAFFQVGPLIGMAGTVIGMMRAFKTLESSSGISDPQQLSANISEVLIATAIGLGFSVVGLVLICIALFASRYRAPWLFWFLVIYGGILLCCFPVSAVFGSSASSSSFSASQAGTSS